MTGNDPYRAPRPRSGDQVRRLPPETDSLARHSPPGAAPRTLCVLGQHGGVQVGPETGHVVRIGRNPAEVEVLVGAGDPAVSRVHGTIVHDGRKWRLTNTGVVPIRFPGSDLLLHGQDEPLSSGYTPLFIDTGRGREHVVEILVTGRTVAGGGQHAQPDSTTLVPDGWILNDVEKLILVSLAQRYLRHSPRPQPQPWSAVVDELSEVRPNVDWTAKMVQGRVLGVRKRLRNAGVEGLHSDELEPPLGNALNHNLIIALLTKAVLVPPDLALLDDTEA